MRSTNHLHSFTLSPDASSAVGKQMKGKKSQFVSRAIVKFYKWNEWHISLDRAAIPEDMRFYQMDELMEKYNDKCKQVVELRRELFLCHQQLVPKRSLIARLFSSNDE
jgi:hypothetical protein